MTNSREKGKRLERELASLLTNEGFPATRGQQHRGGSDSPDVNCPPLPWFHFECKGGKQLRLKEFMAQAEGEAGEGCFPVLAWKEDRHPWRIVMNFEDWMELVRGSDYVDRHCGKDDDDDPNIALRREFEAGEGSV